MSKCINIATLLKNTPKAKAFLEKIDKIKKEAVRQQLSKNIKIDDVIVEESNFRKHKDKWDVYKWEPKDLDWKITIWYIKDKSYLISWFNKFKKMKDDWVSEINTDNADFYQYENKTDAINHSINLWLKDNNVSDVKKIELIANWHMAEVYANSWNENNDFLNVAFMFNFLWKEKNIFEFYDGNETAIKNISKIISKNILDNPNSPNANIVKDAINWILDWKKQIKSKIKDVESFLKDPKNIYKALKSWKNEDINRLLELKDVKWSQFYKNSLIYIKHIKQNFLKINSEPIEIVKNKEGYADVYETVQKFFNREDVKENIPEFETRRHIQLLKSAIDIKSGKTALIDIEKITKGIEKEIENLRWEKAEMPSQEYIKGLWDEYLEAIAPWVVQKIRRLRNIENRKVGSSSTSLQNQIRDEIDAGSPWDDYADDLINKVIDFLDKNEKTLEKNKNDKIYKAKAIKYLEGLKKAVEDNDLSKKQMISQAEKYWAILNEKWDKGSSISNLEDQVDKIRTQIDILNTNNSILPENSLAKKAIPWIKEQLVKILEAKNFLISNKKQEKYDTFNDIFFKWWIDSIENTEDLFNKLKNIEDKENWTAIIKIVVNWEGKILNLNIDENNLGTLRNKIDYLELKELEEFNKEAISEFSKIKRGYELLQKYFNTPKKNIEILEYLGEIDPVLLRISEFKSKYWENLISNFDKEVSDNFLQLKAKITTKNSEKILDVLDSYLKWVEIKEYSEDWIETGIKKVFLTKDQLIIWRDNILPKLKTVNEEIKDAEWNIIENERISEITERVNKQIEWKEEYAQRERLKANAILKGLSERKWFSSAYDDKPKKSSTEIIEKINEKGKTNILKSTSKLIYDSVTSLNDGITQLAWTRIAKIVRDVENLERNSDFIVWINKQFRDIFDFINEELIKQSWDNLIKKWLRIPKNIDREWWLNIADTGKKINDLANVYVNKLKKELKTAEWERKIIIEKELDDLWYSSNIFKKIKFLTFWNSKEWFYSAKDNFVKLFDDKERAWEMFEKIGGISQQIKKYANDNWIPIKWNEYSITRSLNTTWIKFALALWDFFEWWWHLEKIKSLLSEEEYNKIYKNKEHDVLSAILVWKNRKDQLLKFEPSLENLTEKEVSILWNFIKRNEKGGFTIKDMEEVWDIAPELYNKWKKIIKDKIKKEVVSNINKSIIYRWTVNNVRLDTPLSSQYKIWFNFSSPKFVAALSNVYVQIDKKWDFHFFQVWKWEWVPMNQWFYKAIDVLTDCYNDPFTSISAQARAVNKKAAMKKWFGITEDQTNTPWTTVEAWWTNKLKRNLQKLNAENKKTLLEKDDIDTTEDMNAESDYLEFEKNIENLFYEEFKNTDLTKEGMDDLIEYIWKVLYWNSNTDDSVKFITASARFWLANFYSIINNVADIWKSVAIAWPWNTVKAIAQRTYGLNKLTTLFYRHIFWEDDLYLDLDKFTNEANRIMNEDAYSNSKTIKAMNTAYNTLWYLRNKNDTWIQRVNHQAIFNKYVSDIKIIENKLKKWIDINNILEYQRFLWEMTEYRTEKYNWEPWYRQWLGYTEEEAIKVYNILKKKIIDKKWLDTEENDFLTNDFIPNIWLYYLSVWRQARSINEIAKKWEQIQPLMHLANNFSSWFAKYSDHLLRWQFIELIMAQNTFRLDVDGKIIKLTQDDWKREFKIKWKALKTILTLTAVNYLVRSVLLSAQWRDEDRVTTLSNAVSANVWLSTTFIYKLYQGDIDWAFASLTSWWSYILLWSLIKDVHSIWKWATGYEDELKINSTRYVHGLDYYYWNYWNWKNIRDKQNDELFDQRIKDKLSDELYYSDSYTTSEDLIEYSWIKEALQDKYWEDSALFEDNVKKISRFAKSKLFAKKTEDDFLEWLLFKNNTLSEKDTVQKIVYINNKLDKWEYLYEDIMEKLSFYWKKWVLSKEITDKLIVITKINQVVKDWETDLTEQYIQIQKKYKFWEEALREIEYFFDKKWVKYK